MAALVLVECSVGCRDGGGTVRHGSLRYNAEEVFATKPRALELAKAAGRGDVDRVAELVASGCRVDEAGAEQITPLWWAAWIGNFQGFKALLEKGANPNIIRSSGLSTMHLVARREDIRFLKAALKYKGDPNLPDPPEGDPPIREAVLQGMHEHIRTLLEFGADPNYTNAISGRGLPDLAISSGAGGYELALLLIQKGADPKHRDVHGNTLLDSIKVGSVNRTDNDDPYRARLIELLRTNGISEAKRE